MRHLWSNMDLSAQFGKRRMKSSLILLILYSLTEPRSQGGPIFRLNALKVTWLTRPKDLIGRQQVTLSCT